MTRRRKPGPRPTGLTVTKSFTLTPKANRELARIARDFDSEAQVIREALSRFFLAYGVRISDNPVQSNGHLAQEAA